jgi:hypothetical protein
MFLETYTFRTASKASLVPVLNIAGWDICVLGLSIKNHFSSSDRYLTGPLKRITESKTRWIYPPWILKCSIGEMHGKKATCGVRPPGFESYISPTSKVTLLIVD